MNINLTVATIVQTNPSKPSPNFQMKYFNLILKAKKKKKIIHIFPLLDSRQRTFYLGIAYRTLKNVWAKKNDFVGLSKYSMPTVFRKPTENIKC